MLSALDVLGRAGCPQPAVGRIENRNSYEVRSSLGERTAEDSRPYLEAGGPIENRNSQEVRSSLGERTAEDSRPYPRCRTEGAYVGTVTWGQGV